MEIRKEQETENDGDNAECVSAGPQSRGHPDLTGCPDFNRGVTSADADTGNGGVGDSPASLPQHEDGVISEVADIPEAGDT